MDEHTLPHSATAARIARRLAERAAATRRLSPTQTRDLVLMVTEAVTNAIRHGQPIDGSGIRLRFETGDGVLRTVVVDDGPWHAGDGDGHERDGEPSLHFGLRIIDALSDRWGVNVDGAKAVWFDVEARAS
jgi:anti-sigma regulatory factor (Ser/Thr protein kinase)